MVKVQREFTAIYQKHGKWYLAWIEEIPGVNTQGKTLKEAKENLKDALQLILETNRSLGRIEDGYQRSTREPITVSL